ncbi:ATP-binding protein [Nocardia gipuzkoensis]|uniref:HD domain-containing protein n=1 Tax=Nocardia gipuzkoensis TaxID=2749991 RepID=UPI001E407B0C|nr:ATP-binding protein [Nocardia gipuzkoensis]UGT71564.1 ATP-binding protein [Nocardia gipuzkoensis]
MSYKKSKLWARTLGSSDDMTHHESLSKLSQAYDQFRDHVEPLANEIALSVPGYTDHGIGHCDSLWDSASLLIEDDFPINPAEAFVLGGAFLVHDLGMGIQAYGGGLESIANSVEWSDLLAMLHPGDHSNLHETFVRDLQNNPNWDGLTDQRVKHALTIFLRLHHAEQAGEIVGREWALTNGQKFYLIADSRLRFWYGDLVGKIAYSHWSSVDELPEMFPSTLGAPPGYPSEWTIDPIKLACVMRLADATQIDARRADPLHTPHRNPQGISLDHWKFQERMFNPQIIGNRMVYTSAAALEYKDVEAWWLAYDTAKMIDAELRKVDALCADLSKPRFAASSVAGVESPERFSRFVPTSGWRPVDARPYISNSGHVIATLGGSKLYGTNDADRRVVIRELLANALDATRARRAGVGEDGIRPIRISFASEDSCDTLTVRDFGIGMSESELIYNLCDFGSSGWRGMNMARRFPGLLSHDFEPTGQFGIGFFSVFMVAEDISVTSRSVHESWSGTVVLEFRGGPSARPLLRTASTSERLAEPGTEIKLKLTHRLTSAEGILSNFSLFQLRKNGELADFVRRMALMADEDIEVRGVGQADYSLAVKRNQWKTMPAEDIFDALNPDLWLYDSEEVIHAAREEFASTLSSIENSQGEVLGRLGLYGTARKVRSTASDFDVFCGGLASSERSPYCGIIKGVPTRARRDQSRINLSLEDMRRWFEVQKSKTDLDSIPDRIKMLIQESGIELGIRSEDLPIIYGKGGYMTPIQLMEFCADRSELIIVDEPSGHLLLGDEEHWGFTSEDDRFCILDDNLLHLMMDQVLTSGRSTFPMRENEYKNYWVDHPYGENVQIRPDVWWNMRYASVTAEVVRIVSESWEMTVPEVVESVELAYYDDRVTVPAVGGGTAKADAIKLSRSIKDATRF